LTDDAKGKEPSFELSYPNCPICGVKVRVGKMTKDGTRRYVFCGRCGLYFSHGEVQILRYLHEIREFLSRKVGI